MGRLHSNGKGISASAIPYSRTPPAWLKTTPEQVVDQICKLAKKGATPSQIGVVLRDSHGIAQVKVVTGMHTPLHAALLVFCIETLANSFLCR
jgi:small subunit ribosomal protein S13e